VSRPACGTQAGPRNKSGAQKRMSQTSTRSGMTVGEKRESCAGKPQALLGRLTLPPRCAAAGFCSPCSARLRGAGQAAPAETPPAQGGCRELNETSRKHGPLNLAPLFYVIGAQSSGPSGGDCTLPRSPDLVSGRTACPRLEVCFAHASSRPSGPFAAPLGRPDRPARSHACLASGSEEVFLPNHRECCPSASTRVVQYATLPGRGGVGCP
jgi:hypothetical protein